MGKLEVLYKVLYKVEKLYKEYQEYNQFIAQRAAGGSSVNDNVGSTHVCSQEAVLT